MVKWLMKMKLKYLLILVGVSFFTVLISLHVFNSFGEEEVLHYYTENPQDDVGVNHLEESHHVPDYIIDEEQELQAADTFEELDGKHLGSLLYTYTFFFF